MFVDTQAEEEGKSTSFWSPTFSLYNDSESCISFYMRSYSKFSLETKLKIFLFREDFFATRSLIKEFDLTVYESTKWEKQWLKLPQAGTYCCNKKYPSSFRHISPYSL